jgi:hypothetical protein
MRDRGIQGTEPTGDGTDEDHLRKRRESSSISGSTAGGHVSDVLKLQKADCGEYREAAGVSAEGLVCKRIKVPSSACHQDHGFL